MAQYRGSTQGFHGGKSQNITKEAHKFIEDVADNVQIPTDFEQFFRVNQDGGYFPKTGRYKLYFRRWSSVKLNDRGKVYEGPDLNPNPPNNSVMIQCVEHSSNIVSGIYYLVLFPNDFDDWKQKDDRQNFILDMIPTPNIQVQPQKKEKEKKEKKKEKKEKKGKK